MVAVSVELPRNQETKGTSWRELHRQDLEGNCVSPLWLPPQLTTERSSPLRPTSRLTNGLSFLLCTSSPSSVPIYAAVTHRPVSHGPQSIVMTAGEQKQWVEPHPQQDPRKACPSNTPILWVISALESTVAPVMHSHSFCNILLLLYPRGGEIVTREIATWWNGGLGW